MKVFAPIWSAVLASAVLLSAMTLAPDVCAGSLRVRDDAHVLSAGDVASLQAVVTSAPFDGRLLVTDAYPDVQDLSRYVGSLVAEADVVVVGLDPQHHHVAVHFGSGSRVPRAEWPSIERAGNDAFRRGDWATGAAAIFRSGSRAAAEAPISGAPPVERTQPSLFSPGLLLLVVAGILGVAIYFARRRSALGNQSYGAPPYGGPGYGGPGYPPGAGGLGPLGGGMIGAGLGGLAGYELGKLEGERERQERDGGAGRDVGAGTDADTGFDAGGGGSSWDDGGGDGGGFDGGGGGGSDFGS